jgi:hypothetical protein
MIRTLIRVGLLALILQALAACASPSERLLAEGMGFLDDAIGLLEEHKGNETAILSGLKAYVDAHREAFRDNTRRGRALLDEMTPDQRAAFATLARKELEPRMARVQALAQVYERKAEILALVSSFNH